jgi:hypothetical protein
VGVTTAFKRLLDLRGVTVTDVDFQPSKMVVTLKLRSRRLCCPESGFSTKARYDLRKVASSWRHLDLEHWRLEVRAELRRLTCPTHGVRTEGVLFTRSGSRFTRDFADLVGWLATTMNKTALRRLAGLQRVVRERPGSAGAIEICFPHTVRVCPAQEILARLHALASMRKASRI